MKNIYLLILLVLMPIFCDKSYSAHYIPSFSTAGFYELINSGRKVYSMNQAWRFYKGNINDASNKDFDDSNWNIVSLPHGIEYLPEEGSGDRNFQGKVWYRKHFYIDNKLFEKKLYLHFEAIMGKSQIWLNGNLIKENYGGYLPIIIDITNYIKKDEENILAVMADNSNDPSYPPGKSQQFMDFAYLGGIYRDCWLIAHDKIYVTDANCENIESGGGVFINCKGANDYKADIDFKLHLKNETVQPFNGTLQVDILDKNKEVKFSLKECIFINENDGIEVNKNFSMLKPQLWSPESPDLYWARVRIINTEKRCIDGMMVRFGVRQIEFKGKDGFYLNGKPYPYKLIGVNRHQDYAIIGNAVPNYLQYIDVQKLKSAGIRIVRCAHYPQDPSFMDACDELGIFVIVATPGWQHWNDEPIFERRVYDNIRNMVRRDRNHPSVIMFEPILNETYYPKSFALNAINIVNKEYNNIYSASDPIRGSEVYPVIYSAPNVTKTSTAHVADSDRDATKVYFAREWGDNVDDWSSNNSPSRVHRSWGEIPMLIQAEHYANPKYKFTCLESFYNTSRQQIGGTLWCGFDHLRGYHPQNFFGGIMDSYRLPKYSYYMFMSQRLPYKNNNINAETGPFVYIAHELSPFSPSDVTVYSNCDKVKLKVFENGKTYIYERDSDTLKMPSPVIKFKDVYNFMDLKALARSKRRSEIYLQADGYIDDELVFTTKKYSSLKPTKLRLRVDSNKQLIADGSDVIMVIAELTDDMGNVKTLNNDYVRFSIEGAGRILGNSERLVRLNMGVAPVLLQSMHYPGKIRIHAELEYEGISTAKGVDLEIQTIKSSDSFITPLSELKFLVKDTLKKNGKRKNITEMRTEKDKYNIEMKNVINQQNDFGESE